MKKKLVQPAIPEPTTTATWAAWRAAIEQAYPRQTNICVVQPDPLPLFHRNLAAQLRFYHDRPRDGIKLEYGDQMEMVLRDLGSALDLAMQGKTWTPPA